MPKHFLEHFDVHKKPEALAAAKRKVRLSEGEQQDRRLGRDEIIQAYLERLERIFLHPDPEKRKRNIRMLKPALYANTVIRQENFPESHFAYHQRLLKERGLGEITFDSDAREAEMNRVIHDQKKSLDAWLDYLTGEECKYSPAVKFFAMQGILKLGTFDTEKYVFTKREPSTTAPFAEIDHEALSKVLGALQAKYPSDKTKKSKSYEELLADGYSPGLLELIDREKGFGDLYALTMRELDQAINKDELLPITTGEWRRFEQGSDPQALVRALEGKRSNLCIADIGAATAYLAEGSIEIRTYAFAK